MVHAIITPFPFVELLDFGLIQTLTPSQVNLIMYGFDLGVLSGQPKSNIGPGAAKRIQ